MPSAPYIDETNQPLNGAVEPSSSSQGGASSSLGYRDSPASPGNDVRLPPYEMGSSHGGAAENASRGYGGSLPGEFAVKVETESSPLTSFGCHEDGRIRKTTSF